MKAASCYASAKRANSSKAISPSLTIGIIGCGPRGLQCLESLLRAIRASQDRFTAEIIVFEPTKFPGAGSVYDPTQPHCLRMNFSSQYIDLGKPYGGTTDRTLPSLVSWLEVNHPASASPDQFIPRALVGEYLSDCFYRVRHALEKVARIHVVRQMVDRIEKIGTTWNISPSPLCLPCDEVVVTTGHEGYRASNAVETMYGETPIHAFPVQQRLSPSKVKPQSRVLVRGFGLTAIDAVLAMTEGRGGHFIEASISDFVGDKESLAAKLHRYCPSGTEPAQILIQSRTGKPMLAKPTARIRPIGPTFWEPFQLRILALHERHGQLSFREDIWKIIAAAATDLLREFNQQVNDERVTEWFDEWSRCTLAGDAAYRSMLQSYAVAMAWRPIDLPHALGEAWRRLYPAMVEVISHGGIAAEHWTSFVAISREMERLAAGPPAKNIARMLSLISAGLVRLDAGDWTDDQANHVVDAVIAAPHEQARDGPLDRLVHSGAIQRDRVTGAIKTDPSGYALAPGGSTCPGLSVFGRATEGWILGNDTLNRTMHGHTERWARSLLARSPWMLV